MKYCGINLHSNNSVVIVNDEDRIVFNKPLPNDLRQTRMSCPIESSQWRSSAVLRSTTVHSWHSGTKLGELQELGGWKSEAMVRRYAHFAPEQMWKAADRLATLLVYSTSTAAAKRAP